MDLKKFIRDVPDFPKPGILFKDITTLLKSPPAFEKTIDEMVENIKKLDIDVSAIAGIESRGFIFGSVIAYKMSLPFILIRKKGKLPAETYSETYELEYGNDTIEIHKDSISKDDNFVIVDDLLATGGTASAATSLIEKNGGNVALLLFLIELDELKGRQKLKNKNIKSLIHY